MPVYIHDIATQVPPNASDQQYIREVMKKHVGHDRRSRAIIHRIYTQSGIEHRHSVIDDFMPNSNGSLFFNGTAMDEALTGKRNKVYEHEAKLLFTETAKSLMYNNPKFIPEDITHVITVSCTGFYAPGPDLEIVKTLGLKPDTQRFHIGFMGCYAAFPALKMACSFCKSDPDSVVLIVCAELCTLHFQLNNDVDSLLSASVFSDGAAGLIISAKEPHKPAFEIHKFASSLVPDAEDKMAWTIGDHGFEMVLSNYVPDIIRENIRNVLKPIYDQLSLGDTDIDLWAIHPGGRSILDKIEHALELKDEQILASRNVLSQYGNMSSATVLFVLKDILESNSKEGGRIISMAFGPGLTIEAALLSEYSPN